MLSQKEREYLRDIERFEDKYGRDYTKVIRSRIRERTRLALIDLQWIVNTDRTGNTPLKKNRNRKIREVVKKCELGELQGEEKEFAVKEAYVISLFNSNKGRKENYIVYPSMFNDLIYNIAKKHSWITESWKKILDKATADRIEESRALLKKRYSEEWYKYGDEWLIEYLNFHDRLLYDSQFESTKQCIQWLKQTTFDSTTQQTPT